MEVVYLHTFSWTSTWDWQKRWSTLFWVAQVNKCLSNDPNPSMTIHVWGSKRLPWNITQCNLIMHYISLSFPHPHMRMCIHSLPSPPPLYIKCLKIGSVSKAVRFMNLNNKEWVSPTAGCLCTHGYIVCTCSYVCVIWVLTRRHKIPSILNAQCHIHTTHIFQITCIGVNCNLLHNTWGCALVHTYIYIHTHTLIYS